MKKPNNIDELFARKLSKLERTPSPDLWQRIERGQKKESRRLGGWFWYAAASVTILLMAGYLVWQNPTQTIEPQGRMAQTEQVTSSKEKKLDSPALELNEKEALTSTKKTEPAERNYQNQPVKREDFAVAEKAVTPTQTDNEQTSILENIEIAKVEKTEKNPEQLISKTDEAIKSLQPIDVPVGIPGTVLNNFPQKRIIVAHVEMENFDMEDTRPPKFVRVLRQLKNAKQGDEVEWDELGFNPKRILARADERLRSEEDKISDKYQELRNKTKL